MAETTIAQPSRAELELIVAQEGGVRPAARKLGVHHKTLARWLTGKGNGQAVAPSDTSPLVMLERARALEGQANALLAEAVKAALGYVDGNVRRAADLLEMPHRTLDSMIRSGRLQALKGMIRHKPGRPKSA